MKRFKEKELLRYVIADFSQPTNYLKSLRDAKYCLIDNIQAATKFMEKSVALGICDECRKNFEMDLVVLPLMISYELINEEDDYE